MKTNIEAKDGQIALSNSRIVTVRMMLFFVLIMFAGTTVAESAVAKETRIEITGFVVNNGVARIVLFDSPASYAGDKPPFKIHSVPIQDKKAEWLIGSLPEGDYAIIAHHDENANDELDRPYFGLPLEPYGFSNNEFKTFGVPAFEQVKFEAGGDVVKQTITIQSNLLATFFSSVYRYRYAIVLILGLLFAIYVFRLKDK